MITATEPSFAATRNACKLCTPFGACVAFKGVRGCIPFLHGSQGCATYVRRYLISHYRDPVDIASSNFSEHTAIFGGESNLSTGLDNVVRQYSPSAIGIASTCLSETIGDDVPQLAKRYAAAHPDAPPLINVSTASYRGTHAEGFRAAICATVKRLAERTPCHDGVNLVPGFVSSADLRHLRDICGHFGIEATILPDYADTLDGPAWDEYRTLPEGGTDISSIRRMGGARATIQMTSTTSREETAAEYLQRNFGVPAVLKPLPVGLRLTDAFMDALAQAGGRPVPERYQAERARLVDAYVDAHKYLFGKRVAVYGEEDWVIALVSFLAETGLDPVLAVSGARSGMLESLVQSAAPSATSIRVLEGADFEDMGDQVREAGVDLLIGNSKGYRLSRELGIPLVRVGFPIHDRFGGARQLHLGYAGTQTLFDCIVNAIIEVRQDSGDWGYTYM